MPPLMFQNHLLMIGFNCLFIINNTRDRWVGCQVVATPAFVWAKPEVAHMDQLATVWALRDVTEVFFQTEALPTNEHSVATHRHIFCFRTFIFSFRTFRLTSSTITAIEWSIASV